MVVQWATHKGWQRDSYCHAPIKLILWLHEVTQLGPIFNLAVWYED